MEFSEKLESGQKLEYEVLDTEKQTVRVKGCSTSISGDLKIPNTVNHDGITYLITAIKNAAFYECKGLTSVTIPDSVTEIGEEGGHFWCRSVFRGCSSLTSVTIPSSVTEIESIFSDCSSLTEIKVSKSNNNYQSINGILYNKAGNVLFHCPKGRQGNVTIPDSVTKIGNNAFDGCSGLTSVTIGNSVTEIGNNAFGYCSGLTSVTIPNSVTEIGDNAFHDCRELTSMTISDSVTKIGDFAFVCCSGLKSVTIPDSVTKIGNHAFYGCSDLTDIKVSESNNNYQSINGILYNKAGDTLIRCPEGRQGNMTISDSVTTIGDFAFEGCRGLTSVTIPNSVTEIGQRAFYDCSNLTSVTIPNSVTKIGNGAFRNCSSLTSVTIPNSVTKIGTSAFECCSGLTSVTIPNSVNKIGTRAFLGCNGLTSVTIKATAPPVCDESLDYYSDDYGNSVDENFSVYNTLYVPMESVDLYKNASPWDQFEHISGVDFSDKPIYHAEAKLYVLGTELQNKENELVTIYDATGKAVMRSDSSNISMETLEPGIYTIATIWGFFKYERYKPIYQAEAKLYVSGVVLQNKNNELVTIYDATGKAVMKSAASIISMEELPKGTYMVATIWGAFMIER
jgi:hypothetical protein